jgi:putative phage-type endonuclease
MKIFNCEQGSDDWFAVKLGKPSASNFSTICTTKGEPTKGATREKLLNTLVAETISGDRQDNWQSAAMARGNELEAEAAEMFSFQKNIQLEQVGWCLTEDEMFGCSPDRLLTGQEVGLEIKCPLPHTHIEYLEAQKLPDAYVQQVQGSMLVTGFKQWWFMSYCPNLPPMMLLIEKDEDFCTKLHRQLIVFNNQMQEKIKYIKSL